MFNFLSLLSVYDDDASSTFILITSITVVLLVAMLVALCFASKKLNTKTIAYASMSIAASYILSFLKVSPVQYGGSITLCSMVPIAIFAYCFGFFPSLLVGLIYGLLQFLQNPYIFNYLTLILDFILAFTSIIAMPIIKKVVKNEKLSPILGITGVYVLRFLFHFMSGIIYFENGGIWANLPADNAFIYSFLYQIVYLLPDLIVALAVIIPLTTTNQFKRLTKFLTK